MNAHELIEELKKYPPDTMVQMGNCGIANTSIKSVTIQNSGWWDLMKRAGKEHEAIAWININGVKHEKT